MSSIEIQRRELGERVKELNCLYRIAELCATRKDAMATTLRKMLPHIAAGWQYPSRAAVRIRINDLHIRSWHYRRSGSGMQRSIRVNGAEIGSLEIRYPQIPPAKSGDPIFLDGEAKLIDALAVLIGNMVSAYDAEEELRKKKRELERKNIALREILGQLEIEKKEQGDQILANIENLIMPSLNKIENGKIAPDMYFKYIRNASANLREIATSFGLRISSRLYRLSPREIEISSLVRNGWSNKDIANLLYISIATVERHRHNIRRKLGIANTTTNLATYLLNMSDAP